MIDKQKLTATVENAIADTNIFIVDIRVSPDNDIIVELDSPDGLDIDTCADINRKIEAAFDRDVEDYQLEVGSAGLTAPFTVRGQYLKNVGNPVEVLTKDGRKIYGTLKSVADDGSFVVTSQVKVKNEGEKRPHIEDVDETFTPDACRMVRYHFDFK